MGARRILEQVNVEGRAQLIGSQARAARERSAEECVRARRLAGRAAMVCRRSESLCVSHRRKAARRLEWETKAVDDGVMAWPSMRRFVEFDAGVVGRDPVIEEAKTVLCDELGISRRDAFAILRRTSSNANRKLRDVARGLVDQSRGAGA